MYVNREYKHYPTMDALRRIIKIIINSKSTTRYVWIIPFYRNSKRNIQIEFEDYMFFLSCYDDIKDKEIKILQNM